MYSGFTKHWPQLVHEKAQVLVTDQLLLELKQPELNAGAFNGAVLVVGPKCQADLGLELVFPCFFPDLTCLKALLCVMLIFHTDK